MLQRQMAEKVQLWFKRKRCKSNRDPLHDLFVTHTVFFGFANIHQHFSDLSLHYTYRTTHAHSCQSRDVKYANSAGIMSGSNNNNFFRAFLDSHARS